jgi:6-pyruvoyl-tetrahydropterin synthase
MIERAVEAYPEKFTGRELMSSKIDQLRLFHESWITQVAEEDREAVKGMLSRLFPKLENVWENLGFDRPLEAAMYAVEVRDRIMIAHSLPDPFFGPAQNMHGATFVVDVAFFREKLTRQNVVVDIGAALDVLNKTLKPLAYQNLDALPQFKGKLTTTEFLCRHIFDAIAKAAKDGALGEDGKALAKIRVTLQNDLARAWFEGPVSALNPDPTPIMSSCCGGTRRPGPWPGTGLPRGLRPDVRSPRETQQGGGGLADLRKRPRPSRHSRRHRLGPAATPTTAACWRCCRSSAWRCAIWHFPAAIPHPPLRSLQPRRRRSLRFRGRRSCSSTGWPTGRCRRRS